MARMRWSGSFTAHLEVEQSCANFGGQLRIEVPLCQGLSGKFGLNRLFKLQRLSGR